MLCPLSAILVALPQQMERGEGDRAPAEEERDVEPAAPRRGPPACRMPPRSSMGLIARLY